MDGKYYWLKLKRDFFKRHDIRIIEAMENGKDILIIYLKLLTASTPSYGVIDSDLRMLELLIDVDRKSLEMAIPVLEKFGLLIRFDRDKCQLKDVDENKVFKSSDYEGRDRNSQEYRAWRLAVFERDNYTCQSCSKVGGKLEAHHIVKWSECRELRFDVDNGITLCKECHKMVHRLQRS